MKTSGFGSAAGPRFGLASGFSNAAGDFTEMPPGDFNAATPLLNAFFGLDAEKENFVFQVLYVLHKIDIKYE